MNEISDEKYANVTSLRVFDDDFRYFCKFEQK